MSQLGHLYLCVRTPRGTGGGSGGLHAVVGVCGLDGLEAALAITTRAVCALSCQVALADPCEEFDVLRRAVVGVCGLDGLEAALAIV